MKNKKEKDKAKKRRFSMKTNGFSFGNLCHNLKALFIPWLLAAILTGVASTGIHFFSAEVDAVTATVSFHYVGIENGLDPNGCDFDKDDIASPQIISAALEAEGLPAELLEPIQDSIYIDSVVSTNAINSIINHDSIFASDSVSWVLNISDTSYYPTRFVVSLNYSQTDLTGSQAASLLNTMLEKYSEYFLEIYGYNESVGSQLTSVDFENYDYLIALDMLSSDLTSLEAYIKDLDDNDTTDFRSEESGFSFSDLSDSANLIRTVDIDTLTSYVLNNGVINDKGSILSYYNYRINNLKRYNKIYEYRLEETINSIAAYQKDSIIVYDGLDTGTSITNTTDIYDKLIQDKIQYQDTISANEQIISDLEERVKIIKKSSAGTAKADREYVDSKIAGLQEKVSKLADNTKATADEYFATRKYHNAMTVTSAASHSAVQLIKAAINESIRMIIICELLLLIAYLIAAIFFCMKDKLKKLTKTSDK